MKKIIDSIFVIGIVIFSGVYLVQHFKNNAVAETVVASDFATPTDQQDGAIMGKLPMIGTGSEVEQNISLAPLAPPTGKVVAINPVSQTPKASEYAKPIGDLPPNSLIVPVARITAPIIHAPEFTLSQESYDQVAKNEMLQGVVEVPFVLRGNMATNAQGFETGGRTVIFGHSSWWWWEAKKKYGYIFYNLEKKLREGDQFTLTSSDKAYTYTVDKIHVFDSDNMDYFQDTVKPTACLVTCTPVGTDNKRYVACGELNKE